MSSEKTLRYNYRLKPTQEQADMLVLFSAYARGIWNLLLSETERRYRYDKKFLFYKDMAALLKELKTFEEFAWLKSMDSAAAQQVARDLDQALRNKISNSKHYGFPQFKPSYQRKKLHADSFRAVNNNNCVRIENGCLKVPKVGLVPIKLHRKIPGKITTVTIQYEAGHWYASFVVKVPAAAPVEHIERSIGLDLNSQQLVVGSDGFTVLNPKHLAQSEARLKRIQRQLSRRKKGSTRWRKSKLKLQKIHQTIARQRQDLLHQISNQITNDYDLIVVEGLNVKGMQQWNGRMVGDAGWAMLAQHLAYKSELKGKLFHAINRFAPTTKECCECGHLQHVRLDERVYKCGECRAVRPRDWNSGINIQRTGIEELCASGTLVRWDNPATARKKLADQTKVLGDQPKFARGTAQREAA
ncbi:MAG: transposase [Motiliproteus sp.]